MAHTSGTVETKTCQFLDVHKINCNPQIQSCPQMGDSLFQLSDSFKFAPTTFALPSGGVLAAGGFVIPFLLLKALSRDSAQRLIGKTGVEFEEYMAERALAAGDYEAAESHYREVLASLISGENKEKITYILEKLAAAINPVAVKLEGDKNFNAAAKKYLGLAALCESFALKTGSATDEGYAIDAYKNAMRLSSGQNDVFFAMMGSRYASFLLEIGRNELALTEAEKIERVAEASPHPESLRIFIEQLTLLRTEALAKLGRFNEASGIMEYVLLQKGKPKLSGAIPYVGDADQNAELWFRFLRHEHKKLEARTQEVRPGHITREPKKEKFDQDIEDMERIRDIYDKAFPVNKAGYFWALEELADVYEDAGNYHRTPSFGYRAKAAEISFLIAEKTENKEKKERYLRRAVRLADPTEHEAEYEKYVHDLSKLLCYEERYEESLDFLEELARVIKDPVRKDGAYVALSELFKHAGDSAVRAGDNRMLLKIKLRILSAFDRMPEGLHQKTVTKWLHLVQPDVQDNELAASVGVKPVVDKLSKTIIEPFAAARFRAMAREVESKIIGVDEFVKSFAAAIEKPEGDVWEGIRLPSSPIADLLRQTLGGNEALLRGVGREVREKTRRAEERDRARVTDTLRELVGEGAVHGVK